MVLHVRKYNTSSTWRSFLKRALAKGLQSLGKHRPTATLLSQFMSSRVKHRESIKILVRSDFIQQLRSFSPDDRRAYNASLVSTSDKESAEENMILSSLFFRSDSV